MIKHVILSLLLLAVVPTAVVAQQATALKSPPVPKTVNEPERNALTKSALLLSRGQFDQAAALLKPLTVPPVIQVYVDWAPVPKANRAAYRQAAQEAVHGWNLGLGGTPKFQLAEQEEAADLRLLFERGVSQLQSGQVHLLCLDGRLESLPANGAA